MIEDEPGERRGRVDRRESVAPLWDWRRLRGRRARNRRDDEHGRPYLVDRVSVWSFAMATLLLVLTLVDGVLTLGLLDEGCEEANPVMRFLLDHGPGAFLAGKYLLTAVFLPVALVTSQYRIFGTRFRVGYCLPIVAALYLLLIAYQLTLWSQTAGPDPRLSSRTGRSPVEAGGGPPLPVL